MKILLEAPILTKSGYGEHSRFAFRALRTLPGVFKTAEVFINPLNWGQTGWISEESEEKSMIDRCILNFGSYVNQCKESQKNTEWDLQIFVGIPNEFVKRAAHSICITAGIETDRVDPSWLMKTREGIQRIIVPSTHSKLGFTETSYELFNQTTNEKTLLECASEVDVVPYPHKRIQPKDINFTLKTEFNFLSVALLGPRKNIENMINWFAEEFKDDNVGLVLKTGLTCGSIIDREATQKALEQTLKPYKDRKCKVYLLHGDLSEEELHSLYCRPDIHAYTTTTHGEGYGLPLFEAAYSGLPIIATDWSAHLDFLSVPYEESGKVKQEKLFSKVDFDIKPIPQNVIWKDIIPEGSQWAYPKEESFKSQMRSVYEDYETYKKRAASLKSHILEEYAEDKIMERMVSSMISDIHPTLKSKMKNTQTLNQEVVVFE